MRVKIHLHLPQKFVFLLPSSSLFDPQPPFTSHRRVVLPPSSYLFSNSYDPSASLYFSVIHCYPQPASNLQGTVFLFLSLLQPFSLPSPLLPVLSTTSLQAPDDNLPFLSLLQPFSFPSVLLPFLSTTSLHTAENSRSSALSLLVSRGYNPSASLHPSRSRLLFVLPTSDTASWALNNGSRK